MAIIEVPIRIELQDAQGEQIQAIANEYALELSGIFSAAAEEYARMLLGEQVHGRSSDILEYRLLLLTKHAFGSKVPPERVVSAVFHVPVSRAKTMIRNILAKYRHELSKPVQNALAELLESAQPVAGKDLLTFGVQSDVVLELLKDKVREKNLPAQIRSSSTPGQYLIYPEVRDKLVGEFRK
jgi:hypothetical protein